MLLLDGASLSALKEFLVGVGWAGRVVSVPSCSHCRGFRPRGPLTPASPGRPEVPAGPVETAGAVPADGPRGREGVGGGGNAGVLCLSPFTTVEVWVRPSSRAPCDSSAASVLRPSSALRGRPVRPGAGTLAGARDPPAWVASYCPGPRQAKRTH